MRKRLYVDTYINPSNLIQEYWNYIFRSTIYFTEGTTTNAITLVALLVPASL